MKELLKNPAAKKVGLALSVVTLAIGSAGFTVAIKFDQDRAAAKQEFDSFGQNLLDLQKNRYPVPNYYPIATIHSNQEIAVFDYPSTTPFIKRDIGKLPSDAQIVNVGVITGVVDGQVKENAYAIVPCDSIREQLTEVHEDTISKSVMCVFDAGVIVKTP